jgi:hypothetical protein
MRSGISIATVGMQNDYQGFDHNPNTDFSNNRVDGESSILQKYSDKNEQNANESLNPL